MPILKELLKGVKYKDKSKILNVDIKSVSYNSKRVAMGTLFVAIKGSNFNGHDFIQNAISNGAEAIVCEENVKISNSVSKIVVDDTRKVLAQIAKNFYKPNVEKIKLIGITGTNGKTTTSLLIDNILKQAKFNTAIIGTLGIRSKDAEFQEVNNTTPPSLLLYDSINKMVRDSIDYAIIEVSSHALDQDRVFGLKFNAAIFTNLSAEHIDYHKNINNYLKAKAKLFKQLEPKGIAVINKDDKVFSYLKKVTRAKFVTYAIKNKADFKAEDIRLTLKGSQFILKTPNEKVVISSKLIGFHNIYNILAACCFCYYERISLSDIRKGIELTRVIPGRLQEIKENQPYRLFIDYAHTHDALENVLGALRRLLNSKSNIITVFGCGGERDKSKRPKMAKVADKYSDFIIITTDNPRGEDPQIICNDIISGFPEKDEKKYTVILDRKDAINQALKMAENDDIVLIAGKGHENKQIFKDKIISFNDIDVVKDLLKNKKGRQ